MYGTFEYWLNSIRLENLLRDIDVRKAIAVGGNRKAGFIYFLFLIFDFCLLSLFISLLKNSV